VSQQQGTRRAWRRYTAKQREAAIESVEALGLTGAAREHGARTTDHGPRTTDHGPRTTDHGQTLRMRSTSGRLQSEAHSEGAFGILAQVAPPLSAPSLRPADVARVLVGLVVTVWARTPEPSPPRPPGRALARRALPRGRPDARGGRGGAAKP